MTGFEEGYRYFTDCFPAAVEAISTEQYVQSVQAAIDELMEKLSSVGQKKTPSAQLKGNVAEFWHAGTFNIDAIVHGSSHRATVPQSHEFSSVDVTTNFGKDYGLKYYRSGRESAIQQAKSIFERYRESQASGRRESIDDFLKRMGYTDDVVLADPIYSGQMRLIPSDQMEEAVRFLERMIAKEQQIRPEQVKRYQETLTLLTDCIRDNQGNESIPLSNEDAERLTRLAKEGRLNAEELGLTPRDLISYEAILKQAFKAGTSAALISMALKVAPKIINAIKYLIENGEVDREGFKQIGFAAIEGGADGFVKGTVAAALTACCKIGLLGEVMKKTSPIIIGAITVLVFDTMRNAFKVAIGKMTRTELTDELIREMFTSTCSLVLGGVTQSFIQLPGLGFLLGSLVGTIAGSFVYEISYKAALSFCAETGFTMFGLVEQSYELPEDVIRQIGIEVFEYEHFDFKIFEPEEFAFRRFEVQRNEMDAIELPFLRRGVIGIRRIGYV